MTVFRITCAWVAIAGWLATAAILQGNDAPPLLPPFSSNQLEQALSARNLSVADLSYEKDVVPPVLCFEAARTALRHPLFLIELADQLATILFAPNNAAILTLPDRFYPPFATPAINPRSATPLQQSDILANLPPQLLNFLAAVEALAPELHAAFKAVSPAKKQDAAAFFLGDQLGAEDQPEIQQQLVELGIPSNTLRRTMQLFSQLDPEPAATNQLNIIRRIDYHRLSAIGQSLRTLSQKLLSNLAEIDRWPQQPLLLSSSIGPIIIGTLADDIYAEPAAVIIDPGGNDVYRDPCGVANGLLTNPISLLIDVQGDDVYASTNLLGCASALWGISLLYDQQGNDCYRATGSGQGAGLFGLALQLDTAGDDLYSARSLGQAAAHAGIGILVDDAGNDAYSINTCGQAFSSVFGTAILLDRAGNDTYTAGRTEQDFERHWQQYVSLAQGVSLGMRPFAGGGLAILADGGGNDWYAADVYGQGVSYWYGLAFLLDRSGHDRYQLHEYGQGAGIHLSAALLADYAGNDHYTGVSLAQGAAHDYAVGMLFDLAGDDVFTASRQSQGIGMNNGFGLLMDQAGRDLYFAATNTCQGIGQMSDLRETVSLSMLLDGADQDVYSCGVTNGSYMLRPNIGIVFDATNTTPAVSLVPVDTLPPPDLSSNSFDELMHLGTRYGNTEARRINKDAARKELLFRGPAALSYLLKHSTIKNMWFTIYADSVVRELAPETAASTLLDILQLSTNDTPRKLALFFLGYHSTPQHIAAITPWLSNAVCAASTVRTLGKWNASECTAQIIPMLSSTNERQRICAANALGAMTPADDDAINSLLHALNDPVYTVRESALQALNKQNPERIATLLQHYLNTQPPLRYPTLFMPFFAP